MNSLNYSQFLRLCSSKYLSNSSVNLPQVRNQFIARKVQYIPDSSISEGDVSTLIHFILLSQSVNLGFSSKFLCMYISFDIFGEDKQRGMSATYIPEKIGVWTIGSSSSGLQFEKKYSVKSPLIQSVRKLFRRSGLDFYVDQASFTVNFQFCENIKQVS